MEDHYWNAVSREEYLKEIVPALGFAPMAEDLVEFTGLSMEQIREKAKQADQIMQDEWNAADPGLNADAIRAIYTNTKGGYHFAWAFGDRMRFSKYTAFRQYLKGNTLLDYGTATGCFAMFAEKLDGFKATGADLSSPYFDYAKFRFKKYGLCNAIALDREELPASAFDTVLLLDVLEHVVDWQGTLNRVLNSLKPGGRLIIIVAYGLFPDGGLHISDRTGLTREKLENALAARGLSFVANERELYIYDHNKA